MMTIVHQEQTVEIRDFRMRWTYTGYLAGSRQKMSVQIRQEARAEVVRLMGDCQAVVVLDHGEAVLPDYLCMVRLVGAPPAVAPGADYGELLLCFYAQELTARPKELIKAALGSFDWKTQAAGCKY